MHSHAGPSPLKSFFGFAPWDGEASLLGKVDCASTVHICIEHCALVLGRLDEFMVWRQVLRDEGTGRCFPDSDLVFDGLLTQTWRHWNSGFSVPVQQLVCSGAR
jgi:hypothetical protein